MTETQLSSKVLAELQNLSPEQLVATIMAAVGDRPDKDKVIPALSVRLANQSGLTMYGGQVTDTLENADPNAPLSHNIYPYPQIKGGSLGVVIAQDANGEAHILLGSKHVPQAKLSGKIPTANDGLDNLWLPGGFLAPRPAHNPQNVPVENLSARAAFERERLTSLDDGYRAEEPINRISDYPPAYDADFEDTLIRTLKAQTGLEVEKSKLEVAHQHMDNIEIATPNGQVPYQQHINSYLVDLSTPNGELPES